MEPLIVYRKDKWPSLYICIRNKDGYINLSDSTTQVICKLREKNTDTVLMRVLATKLVSGETGWVRLDWPDYVLRVDGGRYELEVTVNIATTLTPTGTWTREWGYQFEDPDGTILDSDTLPDEGESGGMVETTENYVYTLPSANVPTGTGRFVLYFDAYDSFGNSIGRFYPDHSAFVGSSTFELDGFEGRGTQTTTSDSVVTLTYIASPQTVAKYYWDEEELDDGKNISIRVREDF